jgi:PAS domain S-box-containing protein
MDRLMSQNNQVDSAWNILIIDDDEDDYLITRAMLAESKARKWSVFWASNYQAGREELKKDNYQAVLVDYDLGAHTGLEIIREANQNNYSAPLILFTGRGSFEVDLEAMQAGATLYLTKNEANPLLLERAIRYAIELKQKEHDLRVREADLQRTTKRLEVELIERKNAEDALRDSEERYRIAIKNAPAIYAQTDQDLRYVWIHNPHPDFEASSVIGKRDDEIDDSDDVRRLVDLKRKVLEQGTGIREEVRFRRSDGDYYYDMTIEPLLDSNGKVIGVSTAAFDISDLKRAEEALRANEFPFRNLADAMPQLVWTARPDGTVDYYNQRYHEYDGIGPDIYGTWMWAPVLHTDDILPTVAAWHNAVETGTVYQIEHRVRMLDGSYCWHLSRGVPARDAGGNIIRWYGTATNIHEQKETEEKLKRSNQELEQFAFIASHDLQEPLRKIRSFGKLVLREAGDRLNDEHSDHLKRIIQATDRMHMMINSLLELSQVTTLPEEYTSVNLDEMVNEVLYDLEVQIRKSEGVVSAEALPEIDANPVQMRQLLQNLISNSIKFHQDGIPPQVRVSGRIEPVPVEGRMMAVIEIEDNGIGFEEKEFGRILQPFQRLHSRTEYAGAGMGLAICARIVERHGGKLGVKSQPGTGTTFIVTLPVKQEA